MFHDYNVYIKSLDVFQLLSNWATVYPNKELIFCACLCADRRTSCCIYHTFI